MWFQRRLAESQEQVEALQRALDARGLEGGGAERAEGAGERGRKRKRKPWSQLLPQAKRTAVDGIKQELTILAEERDATPVTIAANLIAR